MSRSEVLPVRQALAMAVLLKAAPAAPAAPALA